MALKKAPGVLAVKADYEAGLATIGTKSAEAFPEAEIKKALKSIGYSGKIQK